MTGYRFAVQIILGQKFLAHGVNVGRIVKNKFPLVGQATIAVAQHGGADRLGGTRQRQNVHLGVGIAHDLLPGCHAVDCQNLIPQQGGGFKIQPVGRRLHLFAQLADDVLFAVADHMQRALHGVIVGIAGNFAAAHRHTFADMGVQAGTFLAEVLRKALAAAGQKKAVLCGFDHLAHRKGGGEGTDILGIIVILLQRRRNARPRPLGHLDIAVALVVL